MNFLGFKNLVPDDLSGIFGNIIVLFVALMLAIDLNPKIFLVKLPVAEIFLKTLCGFSIGVLLSEIFGLSGVEKAAVVVGASLPPSIMTLVFSRENKLDENYVTSLLPLSFLFSFLFLFLLKELFLY